MRQILSKVATADLFKIFIALVFVAAVMDFVGILNEVRHQYDIDTMQGPAALDSYRAAIALSHSSWISYVQHGLAGELPAVSGVYEAYALTLVFVVAPISLLTIVLCRFVLRIIANESQHQPGTLKRTLV